MDERLAQIISQLQQLKLSPVAQEWPYMPLVYWECDDEGQLTRLDGACQELLGAHSSQLLGRPFSSLGQSDGSDLLAIGQGGQRQWLYCDRQEGHHRGWLYDVTALVRNSHRLEQSLQQSQLLVDDQHQQLRRLRSDERCQMAFVTVFGRELRTAMHRLQGMLSLLRQQPLTREQEDYAESIRGSLDQLLQLAHPLQQSLGRGWLDEHVAQDFELRELVAEVCRWLQAESSARGIQLQISVAPSIPNRLSGDPVKLRQILLHLVDNAIKFTPQGKVVVEALGQQEVRFCVRDSGPGMTSEKLESLLRDDLFSGDLESTGLGLKLARTLVESQGGRIWADAVPGKGTSIYFSLKFGVDSGLPPRPLPSGRAGGLHILVAEDDPVSQRVTLRGLRQLGHRVDIVGSGLDALEALTRGTYDVVLLDVEMPGLDGLETARQIHQRFTPVPYMIALTAGNGAADRRKVMLAGIHDFLAKPLRPEELADALHQACREPKDPSSSQP